jgi:hypothetical protein
MIKQIPIDGLSNSCLRVQTCKNHQCSSLCYEPYNDPKLKPSKSKELCSGCHDLFYERERGGCWCYKDSKIVLKSYYFSNSQPPPWKLQWQLSCWHRNN